MITLTLTEAEFEAVFQAVKDRQSDHHAHARRTKNATVREGCLRWAESLRLVGEKIIRQRYGRQPCPICGNINDHRYPCVD